MPTGIFGFIVTLGLFFYELRGIQRCNGLIATGRQMEEMLGIHGQFKLRPPEVGGFIGSTLAAQVIYPAVLAAWAFLAFASAWPKASVLMAIFVFIAGLVWSLTLNLKVKIEIEKRKQ